MSDMLRRLLGWFLDGVTVEVDDVITYVRSLDKDNDGRVSLGEIIRHIGILG